LYQERLSESRSNYLTKGTKIPTMNGTEDISPYFYKELLIWGALEGRVK
jgi:hypothetical protein